MRAMILMAAMWMAGAVLAEPAAEGVALFNGTSLDGWHALPGGEWTVEDGAIVGRQAKTEKRHGQLVSNARYGNLTLSLRYLAEKGNSGVYFRVVKDGTAVAVKGFQAEVDAAGKDVGGLYETNGRAWVAKPPVEKIKAVYRPNDWNDMTITAKDGDITVTLNGEVMSKLTNDPGLREGHIALQLHGGQEMLVRYKDIRIVGEPVATKE